jgi:aspartate racemase
MTIISSPSIPDRTDFILGRSKESPLGPMIRIGKKLEAMGADYIAIPCITAHYFHEQLAKAIGIPVIHLIMETVNCLVSAGVGTAGIMATEGTIRSGLFQRELEAAGIKPVVPSDKAQEHVNKLIYKDIKSNLPADMGRFEVVSGELSANGAEVIILGCTELSLIKRDNKLGHGFIDATEVLAACSVRFSGAKLRREYENLIT